LGQLIVIVAMFALLWVLFILPSRRRAQAQRELISSVDVGDEIVTVGGLFGRVLAEPAEDELLVEIAPGTEVRVARRAVAAVIPPEEAEEGEEPTEPAVEVEPESESLEPGNFRRDEELRS
jgi:preprotein translocase subunit YajC